jgi:hypothetical protein
MISRDNYEIWIIDYIDGKLTTEQVGQLVLFLEMNPDIAEEFDGLDEVKLEICNPTYSGKEDLLKEPMDLPMEDVDMLLAKKLEGDLSAEEEKAVDAMIGSHEWIARSWSLLKRTKVANYSAAYSGKESLIFPDHVNLEDEEMALIAVAEGDLSQETIEVENAEKRIAVYTALRISADESAVFTGKDELIQKGAVIAFRPWLLRVGAAAAVLLLLWQTWTINSSSDSSVVNGFSNVIEVKDAQDSEESSGQNQPIDHQEVTFEAQPNYVAQNEPSPVVSEPSYQKIEAPVALASLKAAPFDFTSPEQVLAIVEMPNIEPLQYAELHNEPIIPAVNEVPTAVEFLGTKIKQKLWGDDDIPEQDFAIALAGKAAEKYSDRTGADLALASNEKGGFSFRLGKLEVSRY